MSEDNKNLEDKAETLKQQAEDTVENTKEQIEDTTAKAKDKLEEFTEKAEEKFDHIKADAKDTFEKAKAKANEFINEDAKEMLDDAKAKASKIAASKIKVTAKLKFPSIENLIELMPKQTPAKVKILGSKYLVFFDETNLNFLFSSINLMPINFLPLPRFDRV